MRPIKRDSELILNSYYPATEKIIKRLSQLLKLINEEVSETTQFQDSLIKLSESEDFLKNVTNVIQDYVDPEAVGEELPEIVKIITASILEELATSKEIVQLLDLVLLAVRDIPKDITEAFHGLEYNSNFPNKEPQWTPESNKNPYSTTTVRTTMGGSFSNPRVTTATSSANTYHVHHSTAAEYVANLTPPKKAPTKKPKKPEYE
jgi:hypothetical protein